MRTDEAIRLVATARTDDDLFGADAPARRYRELCAALHPDRLGAADERVRAQATEAFVRVTTRWRASRPGGTGSPVVLGDHRLGALRYAGDLADLYEVGADTLLKLPRNPSDNDLMAREVHALRTIEERGDPRYLPYVPRLVDSFRHREPGTGAERRINVLATVPGLHSLDEVRRAYPDGLDARDAAWMWRRLLVALGLAHRAGVVHGAVLPRHVLIEPDGHGVVLVDWCFSTPVGGSVPALVPGHGDWYPPEVTGKRPAGPGTDLWLATGCMTWLMGDRAPRELRAFARGCRQAALRSRPDDAWRLLGELDQVLERLYGPRTFRPFTLNP
ncbi:serine/threonine protein kinase [Micromonospora rosaria]|uniref:Serine/threonine protein kinase n=1 Tax=Micromonospora rosaria TaxID=47874 RepID=A0A136PR30_9ACTN|nr:serine/threonine protein kinase [Micromonospora rosaria]KXK60817.1 serine/threonine protein kinase [Micromonospora rosaria]